MRYMLIHTDDPSLASGWDDEETKEQIAGYDVLECADLDETIEVASRHPMARLGILEVRPFWPFE